MKLQFKHQKFQADAAAVVCDVFAGQPYISNSYMMDKGIVNGMHQLSLTDQIDFTGYANNKVLLSNSVVLDNLQKIQRQNQLEPSRKLEGKYNLTIEMETGERVIIVIGCINALETRVSGTFIKYNSCIA